jgi:hypothetical protein
MLQQRFAGCARELSESPMKASAGSSGTIGVLQPRGTPNGKRPVHNPDRLLDAIRSRAAAAPIMNLAYSRGFSPTLQECVKHHGSPTLLVNRAQQAMTPAYACSPRRRRASHRARMVRLEAFILVSRDTERSARPASSSPGSDFTKSAGEPASSGEVCYWVLNTMHAGLPVSMT